MNKKMKVLFVCLGNICRSPAAETIFNHQIKEKSLEDQFEASSAGTSNYHQGDEADSRMRGALSRRGYRCSTRARQFVREDFERFDCIVAMDRKNYQNILQLDPGGEFRQRVHLMTNFSQHFDDDGVPDPYFGGDDGFEHVIDLLEDCCQSLIITLEKENE